MFSHQRTAGTSEWKNQSHGSSWSSVTSRRSGSPEFPQCDCTTPPPPERRRNAEGIPAAVRVVTDPCGFEGVFGGNARERMRHQQGDSVPAGDDRPPLPETAPGVEDRFHRRSEPCRNPRRRGGLSGLRQRPENRGANARVEFQLLRRWRVSRYEPGSRESFVLEVPESLPAIQLEPCASRVLEPRRHIADRIGGTCGRTRPRTGAGYRFLANPP